MKHEASQQHLALACQSLADEIARGPSFFDARGKITTAVDRYTGSRLAKDSERCAFVAALKLLRYSDRQIAEVIKCDVRSIPLMVAEIEKSGAIPALKQRLVELTGANAEQSSLAVGQLIDEALGGKRSLELAAMIKAVGSVNDFMTTKFQLLTGAPTEIRATISAASQDEVTAWAKANAIEIEAIQRPNESEATATGTNHQQIPTEPPPRHTDDTASLTILDADGSSSEPEIGRAAAGGGSAFAAAAGNQ